MRRVSRSQGRGDSLRFCLRVALNKTTEHQVGELAIGLSLGAQLPVAVDAMGADQGVAVVVEGAVRAARDHGVRCVLVGDHAQLDPIVQKFRQQYRRADPKLGEDLGSLIQIQHADTVITMEDAPSVALRAKKGSSVQVAFELVRDGKACALVSAGNTGALMVAGLSISGALAGITRPAIASLIPRDQNRTPVVLLDSGANTDCSAQQLVQFALMGACYARLIAPSSAARIALLSNGSEPSKGTDTIKKAAQLLRATPGLNFVGYVEGGDLLCDLADVVVCDGFVGNVVLKTIEGTARFVVEGLRDTLQASLRGKLAATLARPLVTPFCQERLDPASYGGAPLLGLNHVALVCHGSSNARAITSAINAASSFVRAGSLTQLRETLELQKLGATAGRTSSFRKE